MADSVASQGWQAGQREVPRRTRFLADEQVHEHQRRQSREQQEAHPEGECQATMQEENPPALSTESSRTPPAWSSLPVPRGGTPWRRACPETRGCPASPCFPPLPASSASPFCLSSIKEGIDRTVLGILVSYQIKVKLTVSG